ncbi:ABC transporter permease [Bosea sp. Root381]|uniref:ABC transporter permease n=1 Tax=Bosea sp. Root381 TaxID=1736524 RepID=UPI0006F5D1B3|nr:ABC transporter permease [Bosea sp. Root381]KRE06891.1 ABC transporter permease [Bosea sp. Root381]
MTARRAILAFLRLPGGLFGGSVLLGLALAAVLAPALVSNDPLDIAGVSFLWPGEDQELPLGTDMLGRDILSGVIYGARSSLAIGVLTGVLTCLFGVAIGVVAGYRGGAVDNALMRFAELFQIMPSLLFTIVLVAAAGPSTANIVAGIAITSWPQIARLVRAETLRVKTSDFVRAGIVMGFADARIIARHVAPNVMAPAVVMVSILAGNAILTESALSFLGLGNPNIITWGSMIGAGREVLRQAWYMTAIPGAAIFVTVLALNLVGNALNDLLNPRQEVGL